MAEFCKATFVTEYKRGLVTLKQKTIDLLVAYVHGTPKKKKNSLRIRWARLQVIIYLQLHISIINRITLTQACAGRINVTISVEQKYKTITRTDRYEAQDLIVTRAMMVLIEMDKQAPHHSLMKAGSDPKKNKTEEPTLEKGSQRAIFNQQV